MADVIARCALCPRLCRSACPVAEGTGREAAVPARLAEVLLRHGRGEVSDDLARSALALCVDCGGCQAFCHHGTALPAALRAARAALGITAAPTPLPPEDPGPQATVVIETDARAWGAPWGARHGRAVAVLRSADALSRDAAGHAGWSAHLDAVRRWIAGRPVVLADRRAADVLDEADVAWSWIEGEPPDTTGHRVASVGAFGRFVAAAPDDARRMAARWWEERDAPAFVADVGVAAHLRRLLGVTVYDAVDRFHGIPEAQ